MGDQNLAEILKVKKQFVAMGTLVSSQIHQATKSFLEHDMILAKQVISKDQQVNQTEVELEKNVFDVLIRKNPMASDFRETMSILKASSDMERIGDAAIRIARQTLRMSDKPTFTAAEKLIQQLTYQVRQRLMRPMSMMTVTLPMPLPAKTSRLTGSTCSCGNWFWVSRSKTSSS